MPEIELPFDSDRTQGSDEHGSFRRRIRALTESPKFEFTFAGLIVLNSVVMCFTVQYNGLDVGKVINYYGCEKTSAELWPGALIAFFVLEMIFGVLFSGEIILKLVAVDLAFFKEGWNLLDLLVVLAWIADTALSGALPMDPMLLRLLRLIKLFRLLKLMRTIQGFDALYIMITAIKGSMSALVWSIFVLGCMMMVISLLLSTFLDGYLDDTTIAVERRLEVYTYYGTFSKSVLTMFEMTLANWPTSARVLTENVSEWWMIFVLVFQATIGFSVVKVIMGVFLHVTFHVANNDDLIMVNSRDRDVKLYAKKMARLFLAADTDGNGRLDADEFVDMLQDKTMVSWLGAMGFEAGPHNAHEAYRMLLKMAGEEEDLSADQLIRGVASLKGPATSLNLALIRSDSTLSRRALKDLCKDTERLLERVKQSTFREDAAGIEDMQISAVSPPPQGWPVPIPDASEEVLEEEEAILEEDLDTGSRRYSAESNSGPNLNAMKIVAMPSSELKRSVSEALFKKKKRGSAWEVTDSEKASELQLVHERFHTFITGPYFEFLMSIMIVSNTMIMAAEMQYRGLELGHRIGSDEVPQPADVIWPGAVNFFSVIDVAYGVIFSLEICVKVVAMGHHFLSEPLNLLDVCIVGCWYAEFTLGVLMPIDPMMLRLFRLIRLLRVLKLVKLLESAESLYLLMTSIRGSVAALTWSTILLLMLQMMLALLVSTVLEAYLRSDADSGQRLEVYALYGTFTRAFLTMFEITLGNWIPVTRLMTEYVTEGYVVFALAHKFYIGFAVIMVMTGIFIQETMTIAKSDNRIMLRQMQDDAKLHVAKMKALFALADADGSGALDADEFDEVCKQPGVQTWMSAMGLDVSDAHAVHSQLCQELNTDELTAPQLVMGVSRLKGMARNLELMLVRNDNMKLHDIATNLLEQVEKLKAEQDRKKT